MKMSENSYSLCWSIVFQGTCRLLELPYLLGLAMNLTYWLGKGAITHFRI